MATKYTLKRKPTEKERKTQIVPGTTKVGGETPSTFAERQRRATGGGGGGGGTAAPKVEKITYKTVGKFTSPSTIITSPSTTLKGVAERFNIQKQLEKSGSNIKVSEMIYTGPVAGGASLIARRIPSKTIAAAGRKAGLSKAGIQQVKHALGVRRVSEVTSALINPKSQSLMLNVAAKVFSGKTLAFFGAAVSTVFLGKWGQAEGPEAITIVQRDALRLAGETGNYDLYWEAAEAREELTDLSKWEQILLWSPLISPFIGIPIKIKGVKQSGRILDEIAKQRQIQDETGESDDEKWARIEKERTERKEAERIEDEQYYNQIQKDIAKAKADARTEDERYWNNILREREEYEKSKKEAEEKYWEDVKKLNAELKREETKQYQDYAKSNLNFGLL